jgi:hypothetical protein
LEVSYYLYFRQGAAVCAAEEHRMLESFTIRNFRGFNDVQVSDCRRINIVVGDNGSGKTALLEALFLAAGVSPELSLRTKTWRGFEGKASGTQEDVREALWADLFFMFQTNQPALISLKGKPDEQNRSVTITLNKRGHVRLVPPNRRKPGAPPKVEPDPVPMEFKWKIRGLPDVRVIPQFIEDKLIFPPAPDSHVRGSFHAATRIPSAQEMANRFSDLSKEFNEQSFIERFCEHFTMIRNLSLEVSAGAPMLYATVEGLPEKLPLSLASGGMTKLAAILLSMSEQAGGIILVDEIENGFYHERLPMIWRSILDFSRQYDCQIFASTHSAECLRAAATVADKNADEFCMLRTVIESEGTKVRRFDGQRFADAVLANIEVR